MYYCFNAVCRVIPAADRSCGFKAKLGNKFYFTQIAGRFVNEPVSVDINPFAVRRLDLSHAQGVCEMFNRDVLLFDCATENVDVMVRKIEHAQNAASVYGTKEQLTTLGNFAYGIENYGRPQSAFFGTTGQVTGCSKADFLRTLAAYDGIIFRMVEYNAEMLRQASVGKRSSAP